MVKTTDIKYFEFWYGDRVRIDLIKSIKGIYANIFTLNKKTGAIVYDSTVADVDDSAELVLNIVHMLKSKYGSKDVVVKAKFTEDT